VVYLDSPLSRMNVPIGRRPALQLSIVVPTRLTTEESDQQSYEILTLDRIGTLDESYFDQAVQVMPQQLGFLTNIDGEERWKNLSPPPNYEIFSSPSSTSNHIQLQNFKAVPLTNMTEQVDDSGAEQWMNLSPPPNYNIFRSLEMVEVQ
jgi:hypothetical protein